MMVDEVNGELLDIEVMMFFLKVVVEDFFDVVFSDCKFLFGGLNMK